jgi:peptidoglycan/LPS O-acetylase OafA/YrhL
MNSQNQHGSPEHLYTLDIVRGLASLWVVLWHYQNFFVVAPYDLPSDFVRSSIPLYFLLWPAYERGPAAVQLFFVLSGFVFYFVYCDTVRAGRISAYKFVVLRFSRLYPLYFVTLIFVAAMQIFAYHTLGRFLIFSCNDLYHFILNLFFASHWGFDRGWSFNAPTWSVSVEVVLYAGFFVVASAMGRSLATAVTTALAGLALFLLLAHGSLADVCQGFFMFFVGGSSFIIWDRLRLRSRWVTLSVSFAALAISVIIFRVLHYTRFGNSMVSKEVLFGGCFPALVLVLASLQNLRHNLGRSCRIIGDITYSTYLIHFPLQLLIIYVASTFDFAIPYRSPFVLVLFLATLLAISIPTHYLFERPAQSFFRKLLLSERLRRVSAVQAAPLVRPPRGPV